MTTGTRKRSTGGKWPDLPPMPAQLQADPAMREWNTQLQAAWNLLRGRLDTLEDNLRDLIATKQSL